MPGMPDRIMAIAESPSANTTLRYRLRGPQTPSNGFPAPVGGPSSRGRDVHRPAESHLNAAGSPQEYQGGT